MASIQFPIMARLTGKRALVTAGAQGIGRAIALRLAAEGAEVLALDRNPLALEDLVAAGVQTLAIDATDRAGLSRALENLSFDIVVNGVGWVFQGDLLATPYEDWQSSFRINVDTCFHVLQECLPGMLARHKGSVITIASAASSVGGFPNRVAYAASKAALIGMTKAMAADHVKDGVRFNVICPGTVESPSLHERINASEDPEKALQGFISRQPMGRLGTSDEIAALAAYLAADESAYMTGSVLVLDGGATL